MKNSFITLLTALTLVFSTGIVAAEDYSHDHKHEESASDKKHHVDGDHEQHGHVDQEEKSTEEHDEDHNHSDHTDDNAANEKTKGEKQ